MLKTVLAASAVDFEVDLFSEKHGIAREDTWRRGEESSRGKMTDSGFLICIAENEDSESHFSEIIDFLDQWQSELNELRSLGVSCRIDCGFTVGGERHFTRTLRIPSTLLEKLVSFNVQLIVSGYPSSDD